jgi:hypothetical protein
MRKALALSALFTCTGLAAAQTPAPATQPPQESREASPKPRPALNLKLDTPDQARSRITFEPREDKKPPAEASLPGMGGERTRTWEPPSDKVYPPDTNPYTR